MSKTNTAAVSTTKWASTADAQPMPLDRAINQALQERRIVGTVVLVSHHGKIIYHRAAGQADREAQRPMIEDAIFLLASVSKPIVTSAMMRLVEQGRVRLDDPVTQWLPSFRPRLTDGRAPCITIHHLMTHSAGLGYEFMPPASEVYQRLGISSGLNRPGQTMDDMLQRLASAPLMYEPGTSWGYSMAIDVLGAVIAKVAGESLPQAVRHLITQPLGMADTDFAVRDRTRLVRHYGDGQPDPVRMEKKATVTLYGSPVHFAPERIFNEESFPSGGAGMAGTAADVLKLLEAIRTDGSLLNANSVKAMFAPQVGPQAQAQGPGWGFGYGGAVLVDPMIAGTPQSVGSMQWGGAYGHNWFIDPARGLIVVALTNTTFEGMTGRFTTDVRDAAYSLLASAES